MPKEFLARVEACMCNPMLHMAKRYNCTLASQVGVNLVQVEQGRIYKLNFNLNLNSLKNYFWTQNHFTNIASTKAFACYSFRFSKAPPVH